MNDRREPKRARQACLNCRRKKARCSGEKPVCAFCARLNQRCTWNDESSENQYLRRPRGGSTNISTSDANLAARVALLESKLYLLGDESVSNPVDTSFHNTHYHPRGLLFAGHGNNLVNAQNLDPGAIETNQGVYQGDFSNLPARTTLLSLIDVYFACCHNQPYAYFHEQTFRHRFEEGTLPEYLLYAFAATACRFSEHEFYQNRQAEAISAYTKISWAQIFEHSFSYNDSLDFYMVQATNMLAVIDFTSESMSEYGHTDNKY